MLPRRIAFDSPDAEKSCWRIVRLDTHEDLPGRVVSADCDTGVASMKEGDETKQYSLGPGGIAIVGR